MTASPTHAGRPAGDKAEVADHAARDPGPGAQPWATTSDSLAGWSPADPIHHLGPPQVAALQGTAGNRAVSGLLHPAPIAVQRAPTGGAKAGATKPGTAGPPRNSYIDLLNGFQDLAAALINRGGAGLDSVPFGKDLVTKHRSLLWSIRTVFIQAQDADQANRRKAVASWPGVSSRLLDAVAEARKLRLPGESLAAVADQIATINKRLGSARGRKDVPEAENGEDYVDTITAIDQMFIENAGLLEAGPGIVREEAPGRPDIVVSAGIIELNAKRRGLINGVRVGSRVSSRHAQLVARLRAALILARSEKAGSAYSALVKWRQIEGELRYAIQRGSRYVDGDVSQALGRLEETKGIIANHYAAVHGNNLQAVLSKQRQPGELQARKKVADTMGGAVKAGLAEATSIEDVQNALDVVQNHLTKSDRPGEWTITNGPTSMQIREDQALDLHGKVRAALASYMQSLVSALAAARNDYDSIKLGNSRTKLRILGALGGADDPGSFDLEVARLIQLRDKAVKPLIERGDYVGAFKLFLAEKPGVEKRVRAEAEYDADLDTGYRRLATTMSVVQVALVALVPIAGEAALATAPAWAVGLTATGAGAGGAFVGEGSRQLATGERDADKLLSRTWQGGVIGAGAVAPVATRQLGTVISGGGTGFAAIGGEAIASGLISGGQSVAQGGSFGEGFAGGGLGSVGGQATKLLPKNMQTGVPGKLVQAGVGAGVGEVTTGDPLGGAVGALVPALVTKTPAPTGGRGDSKPTGKAPTKGPTTGQTPTVGPEGVPLPTVVPTPTEAPVTGANTIPGTGIQPRPPAPTPTPTPGTETIPGTGIQPRPPAPTPTPTPGTETIPGTGIQPRPPAPTPTPTPGANTIPGTGIQPRPPAKTGGGAHEEAKMVPPGAETAPGAPGTAVPGRGTGSADTAAPKPVGGGDSTAPAPVRSQPDTAPVPKGGANVPAPYAPPKGMPLLPNAKVPGTLTPSPKPAFDIEQMKANQKAGLVGKDPRTDLPANGQVPSTTPTSKYAAHEEGRYVPTGEKPVAGLSAGESYVVTDSKAGNKKFLFKPLEGEHPVDRAEERGIREGEQAPREVAAPMVAKALGVDAPEGRLVTINDAQGRPQKGVLVEWHERNSLKDLAIADPDGFKRLIASEEFRRAMESVDALDYLINNVDRATNFGNYLYEFTPSGLKLTAIDHGLTFTSTKERANIEGFTRDLPEKYSSDLARNLENLDKNRAAFIEKIRPFVGDAAIEGFVHRLDIMIKDMHAKQAAEK